ncbi:hypothetical protein [Rhodanobacter sp. T12-5]|uniref:hypothetical protein n=1 Tax=Rhodanobacter sp. T12-5 TaxID=2024611 RepID=UPI0011EDF4BA|nr:hypothetical protein [Rhodanobacter sp. T12-5]
MDFLVGERVLPVHVISVRLAATIFAFELGEWNGVQIPESEFEPFLEPSTDKELEPPATNPHSWERLKLTGAMCRARDAIESLLFRSIDAGQLPILNERRDLTGALVSSETLLDVDKARDWAEIYGLEIGDFFANYVDDEAEIALSALSRINDDRARLAAPDEHAKIVKRAAGMDPNHVVELLLENERLRARERDRERPDMSLDSRQRTTLLVIIGALADAANLELSQHNKAGETVAAMLDSKGVKVSGRTIGEHLKAVREAMDSRKVK